MNLRTISHDLDKLKSIPMYHHRGVMDTETQCVYVGDSQSQTDSENSHSLHMPAPDAHVLHDLGR